MSVAVHIPLWRAAHGRTGDKGNRSNISVIAWSEALYPFIEAQIQRGVERDRLQGDDGREPAISTRGRELQSDFRLSHLPGRRSRRIAAIETTLRGCF